MYQPFVYIEVYFSLLLINQSNLLFWLHEGYNISSVFSAKILLAFHFVGLQINHNTTTSPMAILQQLGFPHFVICLSIAFLLKNIFYFHF